MRQDRPPERMAARLDPTTAQNRPGRQDPLEDPRRRWHEDRAREERPGAQGGQHAARTIGTGAGALVGTAAGAVIGAVGGPVGAVIGAGIGAVAGGLAGRGIGEAINPTEEQAYWRGQYPRTEYAKSGRSFDAYEPAYRYGWEAYIRYGGRSFDDVEDELGREWDSHRGRSDLGWMEARPAARDAWTRVQGRIHERGRAEGRIIT